MKKGLLKLHLDLEERFQTGADGANHPEKGNSMSGRALWAPKQLENWNWREASLDERQATVLSLEPWARPDAVIADPDSGRTATRRSPVERAQILAWIGFTVAGLAAMMSALSLIYGQLVSTLTGFPTTPLLPVGVLATSLVVGVVVGTVGMVLGSRRSRDIAPKRHNRPDTSIAA